MKYFYECKNCMYFAEDYETTIEDGKVKIYECKKSKKNIKYTIDKATGQRIVEDCPLNVIKFKKLHPDARLPFYATEASSGFDLSALENVTIYPNETKIVPTGLSCQLPKGYELQIRPRSGLSLKSSLRIANSPGTVDADYRGEIGIIVWNTGSEPVTVEKGVRIAQGVICRVEQMKIIEVNELDETERGKGGFGSTGI